jgi:hypothetical protein
MGALVRFSVDRRLAMLAVAVVLGAGGGSALGLLTASGQTPSAPRTSAAQATTRPARKAAHRVVEAVTPTTVRPARRPRAPAPTTAPPTTTTLAPTTSSTLPPTSTTEPPTSTSGADTTTSTLPGTTTSTAFTPGP